MFQDGLENAIEHNIDEFNEQSVRARRHLSWDETVNELKEAHEQFYKKALSISSFELSNNDEYIDWIEVQIDHYIHHTKQLQNWV